MPDLWGSLHWSLIPFVRKYQLKWERGNNGFHVRSELRNSSVFRLLLPWSKKELIHFTFCHLFTYFSLSHSSHLCVCLSVIRTCAQSHVFAMFGMEYLCTMQCLLSSGFFFYFMWSGIQLTSHAVATLLSHGQTTSNSWLPFLIQFWQSDHVI